MTKRHRLGAYEVTLFFRRFLIISNDSFFRLSTGLYENVRMDPSDIALNQPILCPWDSRRLPREMYTKLFVVHFVVIGAYGHLQHLRRERRGLFIYLLMIICPLAGAALVLLPLIALVAQTIIYRGDREILKNSLAVLIGALPRAEGELGRDHSVFRSPKISTRFFWTFVLQLVPFIQSILSLWLYVRRTKNDSAALYDDRIAQLAVLGMCASLMSIIHLSINPQCPSSLPSSERGPHWRRIAFLRPTLILKRGDTDNYNTKSVFTVLLTEWAIASLTELIVGRRVGMTGSIISDIVGHRYVILHVLMTEYEFYMFPSLMILVLTILAGLFFLEYLPDLSRKSYRELVKVAARFGIGVLGLVLLLPPGMVLLCTVVLDFLTFPLLSGSVLVSLMQKPRHSESFADAVYDPSDPLNLYPDWQMIWTYGHTPPSFPCPKAWKDPAADYVWWLA